MSALSGLSCSRVDGSGRMTIQVQLTAEADAPVMADGSCDALDERRQTALFLRRAAAGSGQRAIDLSPQL